MSQHKVRDAESATLSRRTVIGALGAGIAVAGSGASLAQPVAPPTTITNPPRDFGRRGAPTTYFTDPDVLTVDPAFDGLAQPNSAIQRLWTGALWSEGPAWNAVGRYLVWSDIPNNRQLRWLEDDGRVSVFRMPSNNSNGNTFDFQGRQLSCEHLTRRVVRYELDGSVTVIADSYNGKRLNSPNDVVPHPDGSYWFTDPPYGGQLYEGAPDAAGGPSNPAGRLNPELGQPAGHRRRASASCRPTATASTRAARVDLVVTEDQVPDPNGLVLLARLQEALRRQHRQGTGRHRAGRQGRHLRLRRRRRQQALERQAVHRLHGRRREVRARRRALRRRRQPLVLEQRRPRRRLQRRHRAGRPRASCIGRIRLPEICGNVCFGGPKRNRLFMAASQSLYAVYVNTQGAAPG